MLTFNDLLCLEGVDPGQVRLVRHQDNRLKAARLYEAWRNDRSTFERLWDVFAQHKGDRRVAFDIELREESRHLRVKVDVNAQIRVRPSERLVSEVEKICGAGSVSLR